MNTTALKRIGNSLVKLQESESDLSDRARLAKLISEIDILVIEGTN